MTLAPGQQSRRDGAISRGREFAFGKEPDDFDLPVDSFDEIPADFADNELSGPQPAMSA
jgi:hypothetical protein